MSGSYNIVQNTSQSKNKFNFPHLQNIIPNWQPKEQLRQINGFYFNFSKNVSILCVFSSWLILQNVGNEWKTLKLSRTHLLCTGQQKSKEAWISVIHMFLLSFHNFFAICNEFFNASPDHRKLIVTKNAIHDDKFSICLCSSTEPLAKAKRLPSKEGLLQSRNPTQTRTRRHQKQGV